MDRPSDLGWVDDGSIGHRRGVDIGRRGHAAGGLRYDDGSNDGVRRNRSAGRRHSATPSRRRFGSPDGSAGRGGICPTDLDDRPVVGIGAGRSSGSAKCRGDRVDEHRDGVWIGLGGDGVVVGSTDHRTRIGTCDPDNFMGVVCGGCNTRVGYGDGGMGAGGGHRRNGADDRGRLCGLVRRDDRIVCHPSNRRR